MTSPDDIEEIKAAVICMGLMVFCVGTAQVGVMALFIWMLRSFSLI